MKRVLTIPAIVLLSAATAWAQPKITFPNSPWDFGEVLQQEKVFQQFEIHNAGSDTLFISRVSPSCGCTSAPLTKDVVAPGESIWLDITFNTKRFSGNVTKRVTVFCNDPEAPQAVFSFSARVETARNRIKIPKEPVDVGNLLPDRPNQSVMSLTNGGTEPYRLTLREWPKDWMQTSWTEKVVDPGNEVQLRIGTNGAAPLGKFETSVTIDIQGTEQYRMTIPVTGIGLVQ